MYGGGLNDCVLHEVLKYSCDAIGRRHPPCKVIYVHTYQTCHIFSSRRFMSYHSDSNCLVTVSHFNYSCVQPLKNMKCSLPTEVYKPHFSNRVTASANEESEHQQKREFKETQ